MGAAPSAGRNNSELVDVLIDNSHVRYRSCEFALRLVDRGDFFPEDKRDNAYRDTAWRSDEGTPGHMHLSAPCIYANALEFLDLQPGMSFLNVGSGTGYFNAVCGFLLTETGTNHGVEIFDNLVQYANKILPAIIRRSAASAFSFCVPEFFVGSAFYIRDHMQYDRIYIGAQVPTNRRSYFCRMLKVNGILVMPYGSKFLQITRKGENKFVVYRISDVAFSHLITPSPEVPPSTVECELPKSPVKTLLDMCRITLRQRVREVVFANRPMQVQFEIGRNDDANRAQNGGRMQRIGTVYFMDSTDEEEQEHEAEQPDAGEQGDAERAEQEHEEQMAAEEGALENAPVMLENEMEEMPGPSHANSTNEQQMEAATGSQPKDPDQPMPDATQSGQQVNEAGDNVEMQTPHENQANDQDELLPAEPAEQDPPAEENQIPQAVRANAQEIRNRIAALRRFARLRGIPRAAPQNRNARQAFVPQLNNAQPGQMIRFRLNLVNANRLVGFMGPDEDEADEDLFAEANGRAAFAHLGLAPHDRVTGDVFVSTDDRPALNNVDMRALIPNYVEPALAMTRASTRPDGARRNAATNTDQPRHQPRRHALQLAAARPAHRIPVFGVITPIVRPAPGARHAPVGRNPADQPSTSNDDDSQASANTATQTEHSNSDTTPADRFLNPFQEIANIRNNLKEIAHAAERVRRSMEEIQQRPPFFDSQTTAGTQNSVDTQSTADSYRSISNITNYDSNGSRALSSTASCFSNDRAGLKRKFDEESLGASTGHTTITLSDDEKPSSSQPKISRSASLPSYTSNNVVLKHTEDMQLDSSQESTLPARPDSPFPSSSMAATRTGRPSRSRSVSSSNVAPHLDQAVNASTSTSGPGSTALDTDESQATSTSSGFDNDDQNNEEDPRLNERAERARMYSRHIEEVHEEFMRRLRSLPITERLIRYVCYEE